jgi:carboxyl-terminal processing protease
VAKGELLKALVDGANIRYLLSEKEWKQRGTTPAFRELVTTALAEAAKAEAAGDLLYAQELTFRAKVLVEDGIDQETFERTERSLNDLNDRIMLIAIYAPRAMHALRESVAKRVDPDDDFADFSEDAADDWKEVVGGISRNLTLGALSAAAEAHIGGQGWEPLVRGGLEQVRLLATTKALDETFPELKDPAVVGVFVQELDALAKAKPERASGTWARATVDTMLEANDRTIKVPHDVLLHEFGTGATERLSKDQGDDYSSIIWPENLRRFNQQLEGDFVGVGILLRYDDKRQLMIANPLEGGPAARAGVQPNDRIIEVNGMPTAGWTLNKAVETITGPAGKQVVMKLRRGEGDQATDLEVPLIRERIKMRSVNGWWKRSIDEGGTPEWDWMIDPDAGIGYLRVTSFNDDTLDDMADAIEAMRKSGQLRGLVLDLRGNPGGLLPAAVDMVNLFVSRGLVVEVQDRNGRTVGTNYAKPSKAKLAGLPLVVLVNRESASASEIVSGALQAYKAGVVVGDRTFGKGSVQTVQRVADGPRQAAVKVTQQYYALPPAAPGQKGRLVHKRLNTGDWGVNPDVVVRVGPKQQEKAQALRTKADQIDESGKGAKDERPNPNALIAEGVDEQLDLALMLLQARLATEPAVGTAERPKPVQPALSTDRGAPPS